jgi:pimeloyl-ACP methyl ester carboxylesterase
MISTLIRNAILCALLCPAAAIAAPAPAPPALQLRPLMFRLTDGTELETDRGTFSVPEDRDDPASRRIDIGFIRFRSTNPHPGAPIVYLAGGPGGSGVGAANGPRQPIFLALRAVADVIALDQRGAGMSNHIPECQAAHRLDPVLVLSEQTLTSYYRETLQACVARWRAAGVAVGGYDTNQSADDIEDLRRALGAARVDLWGISYGTHLALAMMRRHPASVGRVALSSMEGMSQTVKLPDHVDAAFARIEAVAGAGLIARMRRVHDRFDAEPQTFALPGAGPDGAAISIRTDSFVLRMMAGLLAKNPEGIPRLAGAYAALDAGQGQALAPLVYDYFYRRPLSVGMAELMDGASGISDARLALVRRQASRALLGIATNFPMPQLRGAVPGLDLGDRFRREIRSNLPVLVFEGDLDVRTPLEEQAIATAGLANMHRILVHNGGHDLFEAHPAVPGLLADFFSGRDVTATELSLPPPAPAR